jgi:hypothetical protein
MVAAEWVLATNRSRPILRIFKESSACSKTNESVALAIYAKTLRCFRGGSAHCRLAVLPNDENCRLRHALSMRVRSNQDMDVLSHGRLPRGLGPASAHPLLSLLAGRRTRAHGVAHCRIHGHRRSCATAPYGTKVSAVA